MMKMSHAFFLALLVPGIAPAWAEWVEWVKPLDVARDTAVRYFDPATIRKNGNLRRIWQLNDLKERSRNGLLSVRFLVEYDCKEERLRTLSVTSFSGPMATGEIIISNNDADQWQYAAPGTLGDYTIKFICSR